MQPIRRQTVAAVRWRVRILNISDVYQQCITVIQSCIMGDGKNPFHHSNRN
jgi:hypothetical protein